MVALWTQYKKGKVMMTIKADPMAMTIIPWRKTYVNTLLK